MKDLIVSILNIFRYAGRILTAIRNGLLNLVIFSALVFLAVGYFSTTEQQTTEKGILRLDLEGDIVENPPLTNNWERYLSERLAGETRQRETSYRDILAAIEHGATDPNVEAILLNLKDLGSVGINQLRTIGERLNRFRESGKKVIAAENYYSQSQYLLATYADTVFLNPMGFVDIHGFGTYRLYFRDALEKLKIRYAIFKVGEFKSALEPLTRNDMSPADRMQNREWLGNLWDIYRETVETNRKLPAPLLEQYTGKIDRMLSRTAGDAAQLAKGSGLVDRIATREELRKFFRKISGGETPHFIPLTEYVHSTVEPASQQNDADRIAVLVAEGNIFPGKQPAGRIGGENLAERINEAAKRDDIKALVLRINSPGGSAFASETIRQALLDFKKRKKPLVVSMGSYCASGGYWISANSDEIWAHPSTITGSIGIFGAIPDFSETLASLGISSDGTGTTPIAEGLSLIRTLPTPLQSAIQQNVEHSYQQFLQLVSDGRKMPLKKVEKLAGGRVYDGKTAERLGLVDKLGTLEQAIASAAKRAGLKDYSIEYLRDKESVEQHIFELLTSSFARLLHIDTQRYSHTALFPKTLFHQLQYLFELDDPLNTYAHSLILLNF